MPTENNFLDIQGTLGGTGALQIFLESNLSASGRIVTGDDVGLYITASVTRSLELSGEINIPDLEINCTANGQYCSVDLTNSLVDIGDVILGYSSGTNFAKLNLHGTAKINSIIRKTGNASSLHEVNLNSSFIELSATFTGTGIIVTADADKVHIVNPIAGSGSLIDVEVDNQVHAHDCTVDGDCVNVSDDTEVYPSSAALMGAGI